MTCIKHRSRTHYLHAIKAQHLIYWNIYYKEIKPAMTADNQTWLVGYETAIMLEV